jgi:protein-tyrosine phosphatase
VQPEIYWIRDIAPLRFGFMGRPRAGDWLDDEVSAWKATGISKVVSLLQPQEVAELGLQAEATICADRGIEFLSIPVPDRGTPNQPGEFLALASSIAEDVREGEVVVAHCRAGIGRSGLFAACVLSELGTAHADVFKILSLARGTEVPDTPSQVAWFAKHYPVRAR